MRSNDSSRGTQGKLPLPDSAIVRSRKKQVTINSHTGHRISVSDELPIPCRVSDAVDLNVAIVTTDKDRTLFRLFILPEVQYEDFVSLALPTHAFLNLGVFYDMSQLRENRSTTLGHTTGLSFRDFPNRDITIIVAAKKELRVVLLPDAAEDARNCLAMTLVFVTFEQD